MAVIEKNAYPPLTMWAHKLAGTDESLQLDMNKD